ncbi:FAD-binding domain-containing protein [Violaceomyces palustris]|uniref:FAD-binding domain-containing protein n=1 Tax=Violaceomyces palustris TaxID=1673888 RepID=A0ACD0NNF8_9BASI|nr:FAD-binding domain-containing protein [Violaceomyces palustris]
MRPKHYGPILLLLSSVLSTFARLPRQPLGDARRGRSRDCFCYLKPDLTPTNLSNCVNPPDRSDWSLLESKLTKPLLFPRPTAEPCYVSSSTSSDRSSLGDEEEARNSPGCKGVLQSWYRASWRCDRVGSMQNPTYEATYSGLSSCPINSTLGTVCGQGNVNVVAVEATRAGDIVEAIEFARKHQLRAIVKNTGHEQLGRSTFRGSLAIWTHRIKSIEFFDGWVARCSGGGGDVGAVRIGAGVQWGELYSAAEEHGVTVVGGSSSTVGAAGGYALGGGHSLGLGSIYGLAVDNILEYEVVTPQAEVLTVNRCSYPDLFWALRGGGAGIAIVTRLTYRTHPRGRMTKASLVVKASNDRDLESMLLDVVLTSPKLSDEGWADAGMWDMASRTLSFGFVRQEGGAILNRTVGPLLERISAKASVVLMRSDVEYPRYLDFFQAQQEEAEASGIASVGSYSTIASRLIPEGLYHSTRSALELVRAMLKAGRMPPSTPLLTNFVATGRVKLFSAEGGGKKEDEDSMALHPAWRHSYHHIITYASWNSTTTLERQRWMERQTRARAEALVLFDKPSTSTPSSYLNEASAFESDWEELFFGDHYQNLLRIKLRYDPEARFFVFKGVGSDLWDDELECKRA